MFHIFIGAFFSIMFASGLSYVALSDISALKNDKVGAFLGIVAGLMFSSLPFIVSVQMYAMSIK